MNVDVPKKSNGSRFEDPDDEDTDDRSPLLVSKDSEGGDMNTSSIPVENMETRSCRAQAWQITKFVGAIAVVLGVIGVVLWLLYAGYLLKVLEWIHTLGYWGLLIIALLMMFVGFPFGFGYSIICLGAGFVYGFPLGMLAVNIGGNVGAWCGFFFGRYFGGGFVEARVKGMSAKNQQKFRLIENALIQKAFLIVFLTRFIPFPYGLMNSIHGMSKTRFTTYAVATWFGIAPEQCITVYTGTLAKDLESAVSGDSEMTSTQKAFLWVQIGMIVVVILFFMLVAHQAMRQVKKMGAYEQGGDEEEAALAKDRRNTDSGLLTDHDMESSSTSANPVHQNSEPNSRLPPLGGIN